jgi:hypothetical protein
VGGSAHETRPEGFEQATNARHACAEHTGMHLDGGPVANLGVVPWKLLAMYRCSRVERRTSRVLALVEPNQVLQSQDAHHRDEDTDPEHQHDQ